MKIRTNRTLAVGIIVLMVLAVMPMTAVSVIPPCTPDTSLPDTAVTMTVSHPGAQSFFDSELSDVPVGYAVTNAVYHGWCIESGQVMPLDTAHDVMLYNSYDASMPPRFVSPNWEKVNYMLNNDDGYGLTSEDIQEIIWYYVDEGSIPTDPASLNLIADVEANSSGFIPADNETLVVICDAGTTIQQSIIEVKIYCTEGIQYYIQPIHNETRGDLYVAITTNGSPIPPTYDGSGIPEAPYVLNNPSQPYADGTDVSILAVGENNYTFYDWAAFPSSPNPRVLHMNKTHHPEPLFEINDGTHKYRLDILIEGDGTTNPASGSYLCPADSYFNITATADSGWEFNEWKGDISATTNDISILMDDNKTVIANFTEDNDLVTLTIYLEGAGYVEIYSCGILIDYVEHSGDTRDYPVGTCLDIKALGTTSGSQFDHWTGYVSNASNATTTICLPEDREITAYFNCGCGYMLDVDIIGQGEVQRNPHKFCYSIDEIETVELTAVPADGWEFYGWSGVLTGLNPIGNVTMNANKNVTALFINDAVDVTVDTVGAGSVTISPDQPVYQNGMAITIEATPNTGWVFDHWSGDITLTTNPVDITLYGDFAATAHFIKAYDLTITIDGEGSTTPSAGVHSYTEGENVTVTATADAHWEFVEWTGDISSNTSNITIHMNESKHITAVFQQTECLLTITAEEGGTTNPAPGGQYYPVGTSVSITAIPDDGWEFDHWSGSATGSTAAISVTMNSDKTVNAHFEEIPDPADLDCTGTLSWSDVEAGATVSGRFDVRNQGGQPLNWEISSYPTTWGTWEFSATSGTIGPGQSISVDVTIVTPESRSLALRLKDNEYSGQVVVVNTDDTTDSDTIPVSLTTPVLHSSLAERLIVFIQSICEQFPFLGQILSTIPIVADILAM